MKPMTMARAVLTLLVAAMLAVAFQAYLKPGFIIDIANQLWLCL